MRASTPEKARSSQRIFKTSFQPPQLIWFLTSGTDFSGPSTCSRLPDEIDDKGFNPPTGGENKPSAFKPRVLEDEHTLVSTRRRQGIFYTRLVDDITCSSHRDLSPKEIAWLIHQLHALGLRRGFQLTRWERHR
jgi:hypothetical protein